MAHRQMDYYCDEISMTAKDSTGKWKAHRPFSAIKIMVLQEFLKSYTINV